MGRPDGRVTRHRPGQDARSGRRREVSEFSRRLRAVVRAAPKLADVGRIGVVEIQGEEDFGVFDQALRPLSSKCQLLDGVLACLFSFDSPGNREVLGLLPLMDDGRDNKCSDHGEDQHNSDRQTGLVSHLSLDEDGERLATYLEGTKRAQIRRHASGN